MNERSLADDQGKATGLVEAGRQLAEARAAAGLSQNQLASQLHMGEEQLAALERGDQTELPEPVFIKAMVRRISSHLGLDADAMVQTLGPLTTRPPNGRLPGQHRGASLLRTEEHSIHFPSWPSPGLLALALLCGATPPS